jgi:hypothetical protein
MLRGRSRRHVVGHAVDDLPTLILRKPEVVGIGVVPVVADADVGGHGRLRWKLGRV